MQVLMGISDWAVRQDTLSVFKFLRHTVFHPYRFPAHTAPEVTTGPPDIEA